MALTFETLKAKSTPYLVGVGVTTVCTGLGVVLFPRVGPRDLVMIYLIGVVVVSARFGLWPSVATAAMSVLALDFFFVPPYMAFVIDDVSYVVTIGVMFVVAVIMGGLTDRLRSQGELSRLRERRMAVLYSISRDLSGQRAPAELCLAAERHVTDLFACVARLLPRKSEGSLDTSLTSELSLNEAEAAAARAALGRGEATGRGTDQFADLACTFLPLTAAHGTVGVLCIRANGPGLVDDSEQRALLETVSRLIGSSLENALLAKEAEQAQLQIEAERLRSGLLSAVSHDLRTPLATIEGAATTMLQKSVELTPLAREELTHAIVDEAHRLGRLVRNLLDMTRLESGQIEPNKERQDVEELVGGALTRVDARLKGRPVRTHVEDGLPLVPMDTVLVEQVLINLLENAIRHSPGSGEIEISARLAAQELLIEVADAGSGLLPGTEERVFEKFFRAEAEAGGGGAGLGLAICRAIVSAHGGRIWAENRPTGGASFRFLLPLGDAAKGGVPPSARET